MLSKRKLGVLVDASLIFSKNTMPYDIIPPNLVFQFSRGPPLGWGVSGCQPRQKSNVAIGGNRRRRRREKIQVFWLVFAPFGVFSHTPHNESARLSQQWIDTSEEICHSWKHLDFTDLPLVENNAGVL